MVEGEADVVVAVVEGEAEVEEVAAEVDVAEGEEGVAHGVVKLEVAVQNCWMVNSNVKHVTFDPQDRKL